MNGVKPKPIQYDHKGKPMVIPNVSKKVVLTHKLKDTIYALAVRTTADVVYMDATYSKKLTDLIADISDALITDSTRITGISEQFDDLLKECPEEFQSLKQIYDYISGQGEDRTKTILGMLDEEYQKREEGKGLSTHDLTDILYQKLLHGYSKEDLDERFTVVANSLEAIQHRLSTLEGKPNIIVTDIQTTPSMVGENDTWISIIENEIDDSGDPEP